MAAGGVVLNGQRIQASLLRSIAPEIGYKSSATSVANSTAQINDTHLWVPVVANGVYFLDCTVFYAGGTQGASDFSWAWSCPAGTVMAYLVNGISISGSVIDTSLRGIGGFMAGTNGTTNNLAVRMRGTVNVGPFDGRLTLRWAQNTANATATTVNAGSALKVFQIQ